MSTTALEKVASDVAEGVTRHYVTRLIRESRHDAWRDRIGSGISTESSWSHLPCLIIPFN
jgi:hypothetical protein